MLTTTFRFGTYRLIPMARELWHGELAVPAPRRVFDAIAYLLAHRDRAVSKDELIERVWNRTNVSDVQLNQLIVRARRALGDDGQGQRVIRTVPGFGYRWIAETQEAPAIADDATATHEIEHVAGPGDTAVDRTSLTSPPSVAPGKRYRPTRQVAYALGMLVVVAAVVFAFMREPQHVRVDILRAAIMPTEGKFGSDQRWIRLGLMDLIASRLREGGLVVPSSESVFGLLRTGGYSPEARNLDAFKAKARVDTVIESEATRTATGWTVQLSGVRPSGLTFAVEAEGETPVKAALAATERLLDAFGRPIVAHHRGVDPAGLQETVLRARAAALVNDLPGARVILENAPPAIRQHPTLRVEAAKIALRAGQLETAEAALQSLLKQYDGKPNPPMQAHILSALGSVELRRERFDLALGHYEAAMRVLATEQRHPTLRGQALLGLGTAHLALNDLQSGAAELTRAKDLLEYTGDWLAVARAEAKIGALESARHRFSDALPHFVKAVSQFETYGAVDEWAMSVADLMHAYRPLLRWADALYSDQLTRRLLPQLVDQATRAHVQVNRADAFLGGGHFKDAEAALEEVFETGASATGEDQQHARVLSGELALLQGDPARAEQVLRGVLTGVQGRAAWSDQRERAVLTYMRAVRQQRPGTAQDLQVAGLNIASLAATRPLIIAARAEWLLSRGERPIAARLLHNALVAAQGSGSPLENAVLAQSLAEEFLHETATSDEARQAIALISPWADQDFVCAVLTARLYAAEGRTEELQSAMSKARMLAGERVVPVDLQRAVVAMRGS